MSSARSWSLPKCISALVSLLLKILLWLPSAPSIKIDLLTLALVLCPELDLTYLWLHLPTAPHLLPVTQPPETSMPTTCLGCFSLSHLLPPCRPMTFLPFRDQLKYPTTRLKSLLLSRQALQARLLVSAHLGPALALLPLRQTRPPPHATPPSMKGDHDGWAWRGTTFSPWMQVPAPALHSRLSWKSPRAPELSTL